MTDEYPGPSDNMKLDLDNIPVKDNEDERRYEAHVGDEVAVMQYYYSEGSIVFTHTIVPETLSGQGLASHMARTVLDQARQRGLTVVPICPFVAGYITRHPEYLDLIPRGPGQ
jgi:predicted GNAT family acetyltransferase